MKRLEWQPEYSVGVEELDKQHRDLLHTINTLIEEQENENNNEKLSATLSSLIHYAYTHFATEEQYLAQVKFPDLEEHVIEHIDFLTKTLSLVLKAEEGNKNSRTELLQYLKEWFSLHVLGKDRLYIPYLKTKGIK